MTVRVLFLADLVTLNVLRLSKNGIHKPVPGVRLHCSGKAGKKAKEETSGNNPRLKSWDTKQAVPLPNSQC